MVMLDLPARQSQAIREIYPPVTIIFFPDPVNSFGKASGRNLLTMALSLWIQLLQFTPSGFGLYLVHVNKIRHLKP
jgi:hypothetical protein